MIALPPRPLAIPGLLSEETLDYHHGKHHNAYVSKTNALITGTPLENCSLKEIIHAAHADQNAVLFNQAAQVWNHDFYWNSLSEPETSLLQQTLDDAFEETGGFRKTFSEAALNVFGSGWVWLVQTPEDGFDIVTTGNAGVPFLQDLHPLLVCDVWEHSYYIGFRNQRAAYVEAFLDCINWKFCEENVKSFESV